MYRYLAVFLVALGLTAAVPASSARAESGPGYADTSFRDLSRTLVGLGGVDILDDEMIDAYAEIFYCELWRETYTDDFKWNRIRKAIRRSIQEESGGSFRTHFEVAGPVQLRRYDFEEQTFPLTKESIMDNVGVMYIYDPFGFENYCNRRFPSTHFPQRYVLNLHLPVTIKELKMSPEKAKRLVDYMDKVGNDDRTVFLRFRFKINDVLGAEGNARNRSVFVRGPVESVDFFADKERSIRLGSANTGRR